MDKLVSIVGVEGPDETIVRASSPGKVITVQVFAQGTELNGLMITGVNGFQGGGVEASGDLVMRNCIVADNVGNDQFSSRAIDVVLGSLLLENSTVHGNTGTSGPVDLRMTQFGGGFVSRGHNLIGNPLTVPGFVNGVNGDIVGTTASPVTPMLRPLAATGGRTMTHGLMPGSPALDAASPLRRAGFDQRGLRRAAGVVDIGAHEQSSGADITGCAAVPSSTGRVAELAVILNPTASANDAHLSMLFLPESTLGFFITSQTQTITSQPAGSSGVLWPVAR